MLRDVITERPDGRATDWKFNCDQDSDKMTEDEFFLFMMDEEENADEFMNIAFSSRAGVNQMFQQRKNEGAYKVLILKHLIDNDTKFREYCRLSPLMFQEVLGKIEQDLISNTGYYKGNISPQEKLFVTLRYLVTGESFRSLAFHFRISHCHISKLVKKVLGSITNKMTGQYLTEPTTQTWKESAQQFSERWNFPNAIGSIGGKHVRLVCPNKVGSLCFNSPSVVLLAIADADYKFIAVDIGAYGKESDPGIYARSALAKKIKAGTFHIPLPEIIGTNRVLPYVLLGDDAFPLDITLMKPYSQRKAKVNVNKRIYNYRVSRGRRPVENAFGILCQVFQIFHQPIAVALGTAEQAIMASCILHNMLREDTIRVEGRGSCRDEYIGPELPKENLTPMISTRSRNPPREAERIRQQFMEYFCNEGSLSWQQEVVH